MATPLTGDIKDRVEQAHFGVTLQNFPVVLAADLADAAKLINDKAQSGKRLGGQVMAVDTLSGAPTTAATYIATGSATTAVWKLQTQVLGTGSADVTPA